MLIKVGHKNNSGKNRKNLNKKKPPALCRRLMLAPVGDGRLCCQTGYSRTLAYVMR